MRLSHQGRFAVQTFQTNQAKPIFSKFGAKLFKLSKPFNQSTNQPFKPNRSFPNSTPNVLSADGGFAKEPSAARSSCRVPYPAGQSAPNSGSTLNPKISSFTSQPWSHVFRLHRRFQHSRFCCRKILSRDHPFI